LQLPPSTSSTPTVLPSTGVATTLPQMGDDMDLPRKIVLTIVLVALIISILWCWRLFSTS
jgi:hypothetical protein